MFRGTLKKKNLILLKIEIYRTVIFKLVALKLKKKNYFLAERGLDSLQCDFRRRLHVVRKLRLHRMPHSSVFDRPESVKQPRSFVSCYSWVKRLILVSVAFAFELHGVS